MTNPFAQSPDTYKIYFKTIFQDAEKFEALYTETCLGTASYEVESETVDSAANDIWCIEVYLDNQPDLEHFKNQLIKYAKDNNLQLLSEVKCKKIEDRDWIQEYQKNLKPIEIGSFFITSSTQAHLCPADKVNLIIEASRAFGTGEHATTSGCIRAIESLAKKNFKHIIDIGTGTGILSFAAKKIWPEAKIYACDIEKVAIDIATESAKVNDAKINFFQNFDNEILNQSNKDIKFDLIISNILAIPLINLADKIKNLSAENAYVILSGFLENQTEDVKAVYINNNFRLISQIINNNWVTVIMKHCKINYYENK